LTLLFELRLFGRNKPQINSAILQFQYDYHDALLHYSKMEQVPRSASGQPGAEYWQNRADYYQLTAKTRMKKNNEISGTGIIFIYTNNSPDKWFCLM
jgi:hypothetical protein